MASKYRTKVPRPPSRKRKPSVRPVPPRPKGEEERTAVRRLSAMKYRLAGATYRVIAEKLTEELAQAYADAKGISIDRAMKKIQHVSTKTAWDDVTAEMEDLRRETELQRGDLMALENARLDQLFSKALSLFVKGSVPAGRLAVLIMGRRAKLNGIDAPTKIAPTDPTGERPADTGAGSIPARAGRRAPLLPRHGCRRPGSGPPAPPTVTHGTNATGAGVV